MGEELMYLTRTGDDGEPVPDDSDAWPVLPRPRPFVGSPRFYLMWVGVGVLTGLGVCVVVSTVLSRGDVVWTERSFTWLGMLFAILGGLAGAVAGLGMDALVRRR